MLHHDVSYSLTSLSTFFFTRRPDVESYSMATNSLLKVFVKRSTDEKDMQNDLKTLYPKFFTKCRLQIEKGKFMKKNTGSFVKKYDDDRNLVTPTLPNKMELFIRKIEMFPVKSIYLLWTKLKRKE